MISDIEKLMDIEKVIDDTMYETQLERMKNSLETNEFLISVMGQFSAGKSKLINNLIGKAILPVHITETTAIITLIKYAENEYVEIIYNDGTKDIISIQESLEFWQSGNMEQIQKIDTIIIYVNAEILSTGLIIADTPGVNTIIEKHIDLAVKIMESSDRIMYVMGKPATETDLNFIEKIQETGLSLLIVRTHMDSLKSSEEDIDASMLKEVEVLQQFSDDRIFFVSNEKESIFYNAIDELKIYLQNHLADNIQESIDHICKEKMKFIAAHYQKDLSEKSFLLKQVLDDKKDEYEEKKSKLEHAMQELDSVLERNRIKLNQKYEIVKKEASESAYLKKEQYIKKLSGEFEKITSPSNIKEYTRVAEKNVDKCRNEITDIYLEHFDTLLDNNKNEICKELETYELNVNFDEFVPGNIIETSSKIEDIKRKVLNLTEQKQAYDDEISQLSLQQEQSKERKTILEDELDELQKQSQEIRKELDSYLKYIPQYKVIQEETHNNEDVMRKIGNVLDWATLLIPGKVYVNAGAKVLNVAGKVASKLPKAEKVVLAIGKAAKTLENSEKALKIASTIDGVHDTGKAIMDLSKSNEEGQTEVTVKKKNLLLETLDFLTFEHHFANLGKKFDKEQKVEIDRDYEARFNEEKRTITTKMMRSVEEEIRKREAILDMDDKVKKAKMEEEIRIAKRKRAEEELKELEVELEKEKEQKIAELMKQHYLEQTIEFINSMQREIVETLAAKMDMCIQNYIVLCNGGVTEKINSIKKEMDELEEMYHSASKTEIEEKLALYAEYSKFLQEIELQ